VTTYPNVELALADLRDPELFADVVNVLLLDDFPGLVPTGGPGDLGRDALVRDALWGEERVVIQYSLQNRWTDKLRAELRRYDDDDSLPGRMLFVTVRDPQERAVRRMVAEAAKDYNVELAVYGRQWIVTRLNSPRHRQTAERMLAVRAAPPARLLPAAAFAEQLQAHIPGFDAALVGAQENVDELRAALDGPQRVVVVVGEGGVGKTRLALEASGDTTLVLPAAGTFDDEAVAELQPGDQTVVVLDDAHRSQLDSLRAVLHDPRFSDVRFVLTVRPGLESRTLYRAGLRAGEAQLVHVGRLSRAAIDRLINSRPNRVAPHDLRLRLIRLAEGRPLIAHMACEAAHRGGLLARGGERTVLSSYLRRLVDPTWPSFYGDVLAVCAALGGISLQNDGDWQALRHAIGGRPDDELQEALNTLADHGALAAVGERLTVKPDRLAAYVVAERLLRADPRQRLTWHRATEKLPEPRRQRLVPVLTEAVVLADGAGRAELLAELKHTPWPPQDADAWLWYRTLGEAKEVAAAAPAEVGELLDAFIAAWPPPTTHEHAMSVSSAEVMHPATEAAGSLASADEPAGILRLLELCRLTDATVKPSDSPYGALGSGLGHAELDWRRDRTARRQRILSVISAWAGRDPDARTAEVAARAAGMLVSVTFQFQSRAAEDNLKFRHGSWAVDAEPDHAALVLAAALYVASLVPRLDVAGLDPVIERLHESARVAAGEKVGQGTEATPWGKELLLAASEPIVRVLVARWTELTLRLRRHLVHALPTHSLVVAALAGDAQLRRYLIVFPLADEQRPSTVVQRDHLASLVERDGDEAAGQLLLLVACDTELGRGPFLLADVLAERLGGVEADALIRALLARGSCAHNVAGLVLRGAVRRHPGVVALIDELASNADTAAVATTALDELNPQCEARLAEVVRAHETRGATAALAGHLTICERLTPPERGAALLRLAAARAEPELVELALREVATADVSEVSVANDDLSLLAEQLTRLLHTADGPVTELQGAIEVILRGDPNRAVALLLAHFEDVMEQDHDPSGATRPRRQALPEAMRQALLTASPDTAELLTTELGGWLADHVEHRGWAMVGLPLEGLLSTIGPATDAFPLLLERLAAGNRRQRAVAIRLLSGCFGEPTWLTTVQVLLQQGLVASERDELVRRTTGGVETNGPRHEALEARAKELEKLIPSANASLANFIRHAIAAIRETALTELERDRRSHEGY